MKDSTLGAYDIADLREFARKRLLRARNIMKHVCVASQNWG